MNSTTGEWPINIFTSDACAAKTTSIDEFPTSFFIQGSVEFLYCDRMPHYHIIIYGLCLNTIGIATFWIATYVLCTTWGTLDSDSKHFCSPLKSYSTVKSSPKNYFMNLPISHLNAAASPKNMCLDLSSGETVSIERREIGHKRSPSRDL